MMVNRISVFYAGEMNPLTNEHRMPAACGEVLGKKINGDFSPNLTEKVCQPFYSALNYLLISRMYNFSETFI